jgi:hypothetical protein
MSKMTSRYTARATGCRRALALAAAALTGAAGSARTEEPGYVRGSAGLVWQGDSDSARLADDSGRKSADASFDPGYGVGAALGRWFGPRWRADLGFDYRSVDIDRIRFDDGRVADGNGVRLEDVDYAPVTVQVGFSYGF